MKSTHWRTYAAVLTGALLCVAACTKAAESKSLEAAAGDPAPAAPASAASGDEAAVATPNAVTGSADTAAEGAPAAPSAADQAALDIEKKLVAKPTDDSDPAVAKARVAIKAPAPAPASQPVTITKQYYTITIEPPASAAAGADGVITLTVVPKNGRKLNLEFPTKLTLVPPAGVTLAKDRLKKADAEHFTERKANWKIGFKSADSGQKSFSGKFKFAVCTDATCDPKTETLAFNVSVK